MEYSLAKELKDAGFPQGYEGYKGTFIDPQGKNAEFKSFDTADDVYIPTLEELIEACGERVGIFKISNTECNAWQTKPQTLEQAILDDEADNEPYYSGKTPAEAVARLWLTLNKNKSQA